MLSLGIGSSSYYEWAKMGRVYSAYASVTSPVIYSTAAGTGGPLLWNNSNNSSQAVNAVILAVGVGITTAAAAASVLGLTGNSGQSSAPTSTTAIDASSNLNVGAGFTSRCNTYRVGTVANAGNFFMPTHSLTTAALTADTLAVQWADVKGLVIVPPGSWCAVAGAATATSAVVKIGLIWAEIPLD